MTRTPRTLAPLMLLLFLLAAPSFGALAGEGPDSPLEREGWTLYFHDEFDGDELNVRVWRPYHSTYGDGNNELQCHTPSNVSVQDGYLVIQARREAYRCPSGTRLDREFTSGFLGTRENGVYFPRFARYEIRASLPHGNALWPAFWLRHRDGSRVLEIDVMEYFHAQMPGRTSAAIHYGGRTNFAQAQSFFEQPGEERAFHTWAVEIEQAQDGRVCVTFFLDDRPIRFHRPDNIETLCFEDVDGAFERYPDEGLFDIAVNLSVGGNWVGHPDGPLDLLMNGRSAAASGVLPSNFPAEYVVDYVRVYVRPDSM